MIAAGYNPPMPTYRVITLGCKVNHYESLQVQELLQTRGYSPATNDNADLIIVNTCSVTAAAGAKSRNILRRNLKNAARTLAMGCWATSNPADARQIVGPGAVLTHHDNLAAALDRHIALLKQHASTLDNSQIRNLRFEEPGTLCLPQLSRRQPLNQRAILKFQDGCDAHCTYCIIPKLRPLLWSRPADQVVEEARRLVAAGHHELVLTGVFLGAYGKTTALHRRQTQTPTDLAGLIHRLCNDVAGLRRLRLSSLEPGDITPNLIAALRTHAQAMPHFHLPLQSGSDVILRRMNRQYTLTDYLNTVDRLKQTFDRPAITTDIIVAFPGESDADFLKTLEAARNVGFLHIHAFPFSPREGAAAARWQKQLLPQRIATERMRQLEGLSTQLSQTYRQQFIGQEVELLVEHPAPDQTAPTDPPTLRHGRCERYFAVHFDSPHDLTGHLVRVRLNQATPHRTQGTIKEG